jgi:hypothetical protein
MRPGAAANASTSREIEPQVQSDSEVRTYGMNNPEDEL